MSTDWPWADEFEPEGTYLNSATMGLPPRATLAALAAAHGRVAARHRVRAGLRRRRRRGPGGVRAPGGRVDPATVAIGSQVSPLVALVAAAVPDGATVLVPEGEFTSVTFPFLAQEARGIRVRRGAARGDRRARRRLDRAGGARRRAVVGRCGGARWRPSRRPPRGTGSTCSSTSPRPPGGCRVEAGPVRLHGVRGLQVAALAAGDGFPHRACATGGTRSCRPPPGWYAGEHPWSSIYGSPLRLAADARRFDVSPGWHAWVGTASSLALLERVGVRGAARARAGGRGGLRATAAGLEPAGRAIRALAADAEVPGLLAEHGIVAAERAGPAAGVLPRQQHRGGGGAGRGAAPGARRAADAAVGSNGEDLCRWSHLGLSP